MHAALLSRPQEVIMLIRRIAVSACALALVVPAAAMARPAVDPPVGYGGAGFAPPVGNTGGVAYGDTKYDLQNQKDQKAAKPAYADRVGSLSTEQLAAAYGTTKPTAPADQFSNAYGATAPNARFVPATAASADAASDGDSGWQIAALSEAGLLAAFGLGSVALLRGRRRARVA
jgi:hypothetical protein